jgi:hypothetical protein
LSCVAVAGLIGVCAVTNAKLSAAFLQSNFAAQAGTVMGFILADIYIVIPAKPGRGIARTLTEIPSTVIVILASSF